MGDCNIRKIKLTMKVKYMYIDNRIDFPFLEISKSCFKKKLYYLTICRKYLSLFF